MSEMHITYLKIACISEHAQKLTQVIINIVSF